MFKKPISLVVSVIGVTAFGWAVACSSDNSSGGGSGSSSGSASGSSTGAASGAATGAATGSSATGAATGSGTGAATGSATGSTSGDAGTVSKGLLIDDMSSTAGAQIRWTGVPTGDVAGYWFTYNDYSAEAYAGDMTAVQFPVPKTSFAYTPVGSGDAGVPATTGVANAACTHGMGFTKLYGYVAEGFSFATTKNTAGDAAVSNSAPVQVDISKYTGVTFWAYNGTGAAIEVNVGFPDKDTQPGGGGLCDMPEAGPGCNDHFQYPQRLQMGWSQQTIAYTDLLQQSFGTPVPAFDPAHVYGINFQTSVQTSTTPAPDGGMATTPLTFNFCIAQLSFTQ